MKNKQPSREDLLALCAQLREEDGLDPRIERRREQSRDARRRASNDNPKQRQLCRVARDVLALILAGEAKDDRLRTLEVRAVTPGANGHLVVTVGPVPHAPDLDPHQVLPRLVALRPYLRQELAAAVKRRRIPELDFAWAPAEVQDGR